ncbi:serine/threonine-protein kinase [Nocardiopsis sp. CC223A]|uniref:serine/threonine-protein kinase n=1 Tax=Nocardiopsis sp. CC223A TaxID=3044051 RepID=UPI00278C7554|nr:serine/threonine-protein kinase [Nocardiopsis sp. CC223A]
MDPLLPVDPEHIGRYRLTHRLGAGGMGQVYLARTPSGRRIVVKVIRPEYVKDDEFRTRFAREAEAARQVGGFHTAQVVDADPETAAPWIATAYIPGPSLYAAVRDDGPLRGAELRALALGLAEGLEAIHACGLVHRDLKPENIILAEDGPRIIDFGIARPLDTTHMTATGAVFGTLPYMSPEQTEGQRVGPVSDVFSLGTVLAFAATGANPFAAESMAATVRRLIGPPPPLVGVPDDVAGLIIECWDHTPERRPALDTILRRFGAVDTAISWQGRAEAHHRPLLEDTPAPQVPTATRKLPETPAAPEPPRVRSAATPPREEIITGILPAAQGKGAAWALGCFLFGLPALMVLIVLIRNVLMS